MTDRQGLPPLPNAAQRRWGVGVDGDADRLEIIELAQLSEHLGYDSFWINVPHGGVDAVGLLHDLVEDTALLTIGVGVVPLDLTPADSLADQMRTVGLDDPRLVVAVGAGRATRRQLALVGHGVHSVRSAAPQVRAGVGAVGTRMLALGSRLGDAVVLSMTSPQTAERIERHLVDHGHAQPYVYHRVADERAGLRRLRQEMIRLGAWESDHPTSDRPLGTLVRGGHDFSHDLGGSPHRWTPVVWPLGAGPLSATERRKWLYRLAPGDGEAA